MSPQEFALLVIDMQTGSFRETPASHDLPGVVKRINALAAAVRTSGGRVIFIQQDGQPGEPFEPGTPGWEMHPELERGETEPVVHKQACDAFCETELEAILRRDGVEHLLISGSATDFCVDTTVRAALSLDFDVTVVRDAHLTAERDHLAAASIIEHHHYVWENLLHPRRRVDLASAAEIIERLRAATPHRVLERTDH